MRVQSGLRVDKLVLVRFRELCRGEKVGVGEAVEGFMRACVEAGSVIAVLKVEVKGIDVQDRVDVLRLKGALAMLRGFIGAVESGELYVTIRDRGLVLIRRYFRWVARIKIMLLQEILANSDAPVSY